MPTSIKITQWIRQMILYDSEFTTCSWWCLQLEFDRINLEENLYHVWGAKDDIKSKWFWYLTCLNMLWKPVLTVVGMAPHRCFHL